MGCDESGRKPRNELRRVLYNAVGMGKSRRGSFMPTVGTMLDALALVASCPDIDILPAWEDVVYPECPRPPPSASKRDCGPWHAYVERVKTWLDMHGKRQRTLRDVEVLELLAYLRSRSPGLDWDGDLSLIDFRDWDHDLVDCWDDEAEGF